MDDFKNLVSVPERRAENHSRHGLQPRPPSIPVQAALSGDEKYRAYYTSMQRVLGKVPEPKHLAWQPGNYYCGWRPYDADLNMYNEEVLKRSLQSAGIDLSASRVPLVPLNIFGHNEQLGRIMIITKNIIFLKRLRNKCEIDPEFLLGEINVTMIRSSANISGHPFHIDFPISKKL